MHAKFHVIFVNQVLTFRFYLEIVDTIRKVFQQERANTSLSVFSNKIKNRSIGSLVSCGEKVSWLPVQCCLKKFSKLLNDFLKLQKKDHKHSCLLCTLTAMEEGGKSEKRHEMEELTPGLSIEMCPDCKSRSAPEEMSILAIGESSASIAEWQSPLHEKK